jgi:hypothetical protein
MMISTLLARLSSKDLAPFIVSFKDKHVDAVDHFVTICAKNGHVIEITMGDNTEVNFLEVDNYYIDRRVEYDDQYKQRIVGDFIVAIEDILTGNVTEKEYRRNGKLLMKTLHLQSDHKAMDGLVPRHVPLWNRLQCHLPGVLVSVVHWGKSNGSN